MTIQATNTNIKESTVHPVNTKKINTKMRQDLFSLAPKNLSEAMEYAKIIASSGMVPKSFQGRPGDVLVAVQMGVELGLPPTQALQNIAVINGRPSLWGDAVLAIVKGSPVCDYVREYFDAKTGVATCIAKRTDDAEEVVKTFSYEDAKRAGLWGKQGPWTQYPQRMAQMRARSWAVRDAFPDLLRGISVYEEQQDCVEKAIKPVSKTMVDIGSKAEALLHHLKAQSAAEPVEISETIADEATVSVHLIVDQINEANNEAQLMPIAEQAKTLSEADQAIARDAYKQKLATLRGVEHSEHEIVDNTDESETACYESDVPVF